MSRRDGGGALILAVAVGIIVAGVAASFLDHAPWVLPWTLVAIICGRLAAQITRRRRAPVSRRVPVLIATAGVVIAGVIWIGFGRELNRDTRVQLRARPAAAVAAYERQHAPHRHHQRSRHHHRRSGRRGHPATPSPHARAAPSPAARFYGVGQLGRWHWQRIIAGWSALLGMPLVLWGIAAGIATAGRRRRGNHPPPPGLSLDQQGAGRLRTAGRGVR